MKSTGMSKANTRSRVSTTSTKKAAPTMSRVVKKKDPEKEAARKATQTEGMTDKQRILYNQKGRVGQKMYSKKIAKGNAKPETTTKSGSTTTKVKQPRAERVAARRAYNKDMADKGGRGKTFDNLAKTAGTLLTSWGLYQAGKKKQD